MNTSAQRYVIRQFALERLLAARLLAGLLLAAVLVGCPKGGPDVMTPVDSNSPDVAAGETLDPPATNPQPMNPPATNPATDPTGVTPVSSSPTVNVTGEGIWAVSDMFSLTDRTEAFADTSLLGEDGRSVSLLAAANETLSFQLVIDAPAEGMRSVNVRFDGLEGIAEATFFRMLPVEIDEFPAWYIRQSQRPLQVASFYDPLVPLDSPEGGQPYDLPARGRLAIWVDVRVSRTALPGRYSGAVRVSASGETDRQLPVELEVLDLMLPDSRPIAALGAFEHQAIFRRFVRRDGEPYVPVVMDPEKPEVRRGLDVMNELMTLAHEHRLDLFDRTLHPRIARDQQGQIGLDWRFYDAIVAPYLSGEAFEDRVGVSAWPIPYRQDWPVPEYYGGLDSQTYADAAEIVITLCGRHFRSMGAEEKMFAWPYRRAVRPDAMDELQRMAGLIRRADRGIAVLANLPLTPPPETNWTIPADLPGRVDILAPPGQWLRPEAGADLATARHPLHGLWLTPGPEPYVPSLSFLADPTDARALAWVAYKYRCTGLLLPEVLNWSGRPYEDPAGSGGRLLYPADRIGREGVLPSARLKRLRRGLQDITWLWVLRQRRREGLADALADAMIRYAGQQAADEHYLDPRLNGWVRDARLWTRARRLLLAEVYAAVHPDKAADRQTETRLLWRELIEGASRVRIEQAQAYIRRPGDEESNNALRATVRLELYNELNRPADVKIDILALPAGWSARRNSIRIEALPADSRRTVELVIEGQSLPPTLDGQYPLRLRLETRGMPPREVSPRMSFLVAGQAAQPIRIDGRLDEWIERPGTMAGNFRLLGRRGQIDDGLARRQTLVQVLHDEDYLYFAFRCEEPNPDGMKIRPSNQVRYEQLLAVGEDLVEIILDPGGKAKSASELVHLIVKPNGVVIAERGISGDSVRGESRPLAAQIVSATRTQSDHWTAEVRIPRSAFAEDGNESFWGANFTRFATQGFEASSWSGAERYFYDPRSLGTMFVMQPREDGDQP